MADCAEFVPTSTKNLPYDLVVERDFDPNSKVYDGIIAVSKLQNPSSEALKALNNLINAASLIDESFHNHVSVIGLENHFARRLIFSPTGTLSPDYDDVRSYQEAAMKGVKRALSAGIKKPLLILPTDPDFPKCQLVTLLGALEALYTDLQLREYEPKKFPKVSVLGVFSQSSAEDTVQATVKTAVALESGRWVARDIGGGDPERMAPPAAQAYIENVFKNSSVTVNSISDERALRQQYPLFAAVNRCASVVERHRGRVVWLKYSPKNGHANRSVILVGKGVTFDTGGVDVKIGGGSVGMSRDKCGAAAVAGFLQLVNILQPNVEVVGALCLVRNSIGSNAYVADEVIVARSGQRVRIGNTDAEGRMAMADILCEAKELALGLPDPHIFTIATLTGHARLYAGPYAIVMNNAPAREVKLDVSLTDCGRRIGDPFEISNLFREDFAFHRVNDENSDILQANNKPSVQTSRGHQGPGAFLILASDLFKHGLKSPKPLKYSHLDIAGSAGEHPQNPSGSPILALAEMFLL